MWLSWHRLWQLSGLVTPVTMGLSSPPPWYSTPHSKQSLFSFVLLIWLLGQIREIVTINNWADFILLTDIMCFLSQMNLQESVEYDNMHLYANFLCLDWNRSHLIHSISLSFVVTAWSNLHQLKLMTGSYHVLWVLPSNGPLGHWNNWQARVQVSVQSPSPKSLKGEVSLWTSH